MNDARSNAKDGGIPVLRVPRGYIARQPKRTGLWADGPTSFFDNARVARALDPSEAEAEMLRTPRTRVQYYFGKADETYISDAPTKHKAPFRKARAKRGSTKTMKRSPSTVAHAGTVKTKPMKGRRRRTEKWVLRWDTGKQVYVEATTKRTLTQGQAAWWTKRAKEARRRRTKTGHTLVLVVLR